MLLMNRTLLKLSKGLWGWMAAIAGLKMVTLIGAAAFAKTISWNSTGCTEILA